MTDPSALADAWERIHRAVVDAAPGAAAAIAARRAADWKAVPPTDRMVLLAATLRREDPTVPATRRRLRDLVRAIAGPLADDAPSVAEEAPERRQAPRRAWLEAVANPAFPAALEAAAGPTAALAVVRTAAPGITHAHAFRFLAHLGYPVAVPDAARLRWLERFGLVPAGANAAAQRAAALRALSALAEAAAVPLSDVDVVLAEFTGAEGASRQAAWCTARPRCTECPVATACPAAAAFREASAPPARTLAETFLPDDRPREKLAQRGPAALTDAELLAILLRTGSGGENAVALANRVLRTFGSLDRLAEASLAELARLRGLGGVKAVTIQAALELARRRSQTDPRQSGTLDSSRAVFDLLAPRFLGAKTETFLVLLLNNKHVLMRAVTVSEGTLTQSLVHPREAFAEAIRDRAAAVVFAHNHPSGDPTPSRDDLAVTDRLVKAGEVVGIRVLDHIIIGRERYYSFADEGRLAPVR